VEFHGPGVAGLSMDERFSISNMTTEWGALVGWFPVDRVTLAYLKERRHALGQSSAFDRFTEAELEEWAADPPRPSSTAQYAGVIELDLSQVTPHVSGPDSVQVMRSVADIEAEKVAIQKAYLVSCVNSRLEDLAAAAAVLKDRRVADGVEMYVAAASREVQDAAEASGAWGILIEAGARPLPPGCGPCIGLGMGLLEPGEVGISATNRNFKGRMGSRDAQAYLASPSVVAASAVAGYIRAAEASADRTPTYVFRLNHTENVGAAEVAIEKGFPARHEGRLLFVPQDNLNTDGIYGKDFTYREGMTREEMAEVVMRNYDPDFASAVETGDVLVGGYNFGTGSSREQAATALQCAGIALVIAGSFSQTYLRNAFNNGFVCIECPALVDRLKQRFAEAGLPTLIPGDRLVIDFGRGTVRMAEEKFAFVPLGAVPQALVVAGGIENQIRARLGVTG
jgi:homoaconitate hydratase